MRTQFICSTVPFHQHVVLFLALPLAWVRLLARVCTSSLIAVVVVRPPVSPLRVALFLARALRPLIKRAGGEGEREAEERNSERNREKKRDGFRWLAWGISVISRDYSSSQEQRTASQLRAVGLCRRCSTAAPTLMLMPQYFGRCMCKRSDLLARATSFTCASGYSRGTFTPVVDFFFVLYYLYKEIFNYFC